MARVEGGAVTIIVDWPGLKNLIDTRNLNYRFEEDNVSYSVFSIDGQYFYVATIYKSGQAPDNQATYDTYRADFESNYKYRITDFNATDPFFLTSADGYSIVLKDGNAPTANDGYGIAVIGIDGSSYRMLKMDTSGRPVMVGAGTAGSQQGGIVTVQGDPSGVPVPITGAISATNPSVGTNDTAMPGSSTQIGGTDGTNLRAARVFDLDSGGGQQWVLGVGLRKSSGGGSVELGTSSDPIRIDPTGTTPQPATQSGTWTVQPGNTANTTPWLITINQGGNSAAVTASNALKIDGSAVTQPVSGTVTVQQATASNLRAQLASEVSTGTSIPSTAVMVGGSDGSLLRAIFVDSSGRQFVVGAAANGAAVAGNPVLIAGSDGTNARSIRTATDGTVRVDPTGTTTQPVSGTVAATQSGTWTVQQGTPPWSVVGPGASGAAVSGNPVRIAGSDGTNTRDISTDTSGRQVMVGAAADGTAVTGNPVLIGGQDGTNVQSIATDGYGRPNIYLGQWFGSAAPTVGQKAMASSIPVTISSDQSTLNVAITTSSGTAISIVSKGYLDTNATNYYEYTVPGGQSLIATAFYSGGAPQNSAAGAVRASLIIHDSTATSFVPNGDFESAADVTAWAAVTGAFTAPSPDVSSVQFFTGASSMRWIYTSSATAHERKNTFASPIDTTGYRYITARFFNDAATATTRTISIVLTSGANTRTYSLSGTLGTAPFTSNTWIQLVADLENPTATSGTTFDESVVNAISVRMQDLANKSGTVYWDTVRLEDSLNFKHLIFSADGTSVQVITAPESYSAGTTLYLRTKNTNNTRTEFATVLNGTLQ